MSLSFGKVSFINSIPLFCSERERGFDFVESYPAKLNDLTARGKLDVALISRWIYPAVQKNYAVIKNFCIGGDGEIMSIKLFSKFDISKLADKKIFITEQTGTSSRAFNFICEKKYGFNLLNCRRADLLSADAALFIGNQALASDSAGFDYVYDLGDLWKREVGLPMLYAVFVVRRELFETVSERVRDFAEASLAEFSRDKSKYISIAQKKFFDDQRVEISTSELCKYYDCLRYRFDDADFEKSFNFVTENGYL